MRKSIYICIKDWISSYRFINIICKPCWMVDAIRRRGTCFFACWVLLHSLKFYLSKKIPYVCHFPPFKSNLPCSKSYNSLYYYTKILKVYIDFSWTKNHLRGTAFFCLSIWVSQQCININIHVNISRT